MPILVNIEGKLHNISTYIYILCYNFIQNLIFSQTKASLFGVMPQLDFLVDYRRMKGILLGRFKKFIRSDISASEQGHTRFALWKLLRVKWWIFR